MTAEPFSFEPEIEVLLRDVARHPDSNLFRIPRKAVVPTLLGTSSPFSSHTDALTSAEKEILRVHRAEVAWLLRQACLQELTEAPRGIQFVNPHDVSDCAAKTLSDSELKRRVNELQRIESRAEPDCSALALLSEHVARSNGRRASVAELAAMSHRLEPTHQARILTALDFAQGNSPRAALRLFATVLDSFPTPHEYQRCCEGMGFIHHKLGNMQRSREAYAEARKGDGPHIHADINSLILALELGIVEDAMESSKHLDDVIQPSDPIVDWNVDMLSSWVRALGGRPAVVSTKNIQEGMDRLGSVARRIANALT